MRLPLIDEIPPNDVIAAGEEAFEEWILDRLAESAIKSVEDYDARTRLRNRLIPRVDGRPMDRWDGVERS